MISINNRILIIMSTTANFYLHPGIKQKEKALNVMNELFYYEA
ncbi:MAG: hypothetical protein UIM24_03940 [Clostridia bacterium]|nr:hypothetical protein [Clostridia bacterium]